MARWNNGFVDVKGNRILSSKSLPNDAPNEKTIAGFSDYARRAEQRKIVMLSRGRFTSKADVSYDFSDTNVSEFYRGAAGLSFVDYNGQAFSAGGDIRDINAHGGGMPETRNGVSIGGGIPSRKSEFRRKLSLRLDHASPVERT